MQMQLEYSLNFIQNTLDGHSLLLENHMLEYTFQHLQIFLSKGLRFIIRDKNIIYSPKWQSYSLLFLQSGTLVGVNFQGVAIGNGILSEYQQMNSVVSLLYYRGIFGKE